MTRTIVESKTKTAIIGFDQPFCVIGERINPTGRKILNEELERGDFSRVEADALAQVAAGATVLDINSGAVFSGKMAEDPRGVLGSKKARQQGRDIRRPASVQGGARRHALAIPAAQLQLAARHAVDGFCWCGGRGQAIVA